METNINSIRIKCSENSDNAAVGSIVLRETEPTQYDRIHCHILRGAVETHRWPLECEAPMETRDQGPERLGVGGPVCGGGVGQGTRWPIKSPTKKTQTKPNQIWRPTIMADTRTVNLIFREKDSIYILGLRMYWVSDWVFKNRGDIPETKKPQKIGL